jgi:Glycosyltransferase family 92
MYNEIKPRVRIPHVLLIAITLASLGQQLRHVNPWRAISEEQLASAVPAKTSSCTSYQAYPWPKEHSGLPYLADVFATHDSEYVMFIGINRGSCLEKIKQSNADGFSKHDSHGYRFMCMFNGEIPVISEFVTPSAFAFGMYNYVFRCKVPDQVKEQVHAGQLVTSLHLDLHSLHDLEQPPIGTYDGQHGRVHYNMLKFPSRAISDLPKVADIPVCHPDTTNNKRTHNLTAYTRLKSSYLINHYMTTSNQTFYAPHNYSNKTGSPHYRINEWIAYHRTQGFDHFVIYDNDAEPHGPIETLLQPYIHSGLVTYRWFPLEDCYQDYGNDKGLFRPYAQAAAGVAALHRMGTNTRFFASMDVDEFFVLYDDRTIMQFLDTVSAETDCVGFNPTEIEYCKGTNVIDLKASPLAARKCINEKSAPANLKLIMRPERILLYEVHYPVMTHNWKKPTNLVIDDPVGILAHYRGEPELGIYNKGPSTPFTRMDKFLAMMGNSSRTA